MCCTDKITSIQNNKQDAVESNQIKKLAAELEESKNEINMLKKSC